jgi:hypothetical protein
MTDKVDDQRRKVDGAPREQQGDDTGGCVDAGRQRLIRRPG